MHGHMCLPPAGVVSTVRILCGLVGLCWSPERTYSWYLMLSLHTLQLALSFWALVLSVGLCTNFLRKQPTQDLKRTKKWQFAIGVLIASCAFYWGRVCFDTGIGRLRLEGQDAGTWEVCFPERPALQNHEHLRVSPWTFCGPKPSFSTCTCDLCKPLQRHASRMACCSSQEPDPNSIGQGN